MPRKSGIKGAILGRSTSQKHKNRVRWRMYKTNAQKRQEAAESIAKERSN